MPIGARQRDILQADVTRMGLQDAAVDIGNPCMSDIHTPTLQNCKTHNLTGFYMTLVLLYNSKI